MSDEVKYCYRHSNVETAVSCSDCGRPICTDCMVYGAVGVKCPDCARLPSSAIVRLRGDKLARALGAAIFGGILIGLALAAIGYIFALLLGFLVGIAMGELVLWASGRYHGSETAAIAAGGAVWSYAAPYIYVYGLDLGSVAIGLTSSPFVVLGAALAAFVAYRRAQ